MYDEGTSHGTRESYVEILEGRPRRHVVREMDLERMVILFWKQEAVSCQGEIGFG